VGGIFGGYVFTKYYDDFFKPLMGKDYGHTTLVDVTGSWSTEAILVYGIVLIVIAMLIPKKELFDEADLELLQRDERPDIDQTQEFEVIK